MKICLITGANGQDGSYLAELLLSKGYMVYGLDRYKSSLNYRNINHLIPNPNFKLISGNMLDGDRLREIIKEIQPDEIYNLAAQSHVGESFKQPLYTSDVNAMGTARLLSAMEKEAPLAKFYQASTSELFGDRPPGEFQTENTPFNPRSPYGVSKLFAHHMTKNYRERGFFCCSGILFNHEAPRRGDNFVTKKITNAVAAIHLGKQSKLQLGNLDSMRDWGHAQDYVYGMWLMLQHDIPDDYILASGKPTSVRKFVELAFSAVDIEIVWIGSGVDEIGYNPKTSEILVEINPEFYRPTEVSYLCGDSTKARTTLGWNPTIDLKSMTFEMVSKAIELLK